MGIFDFLKKNKQESPKPEISENNASICEAVPPIIPDEPKCNDSRPNVYVPEVMLNNIILVYKYNKVKFTPSHEAETIVKHMQSENKWELKERENKDGNIELVYNDSIFGVLEQKIDMIKDWNKRGDLVRVWLENYGESGNIVFLAFYRNEQERLKSKGCESTIVKLTRYSNEDVQDTISGIADGTPLDFDENYSYDLPDGTVCITYGAMIGALPKKYAQKYSSEGAEAVFLHHLDYDIEKQKDIPYVIIYW